ncbi:sec34-domain-containing protein [Moesziomyces antarcticus]|uniref:Conserved oligomeric Golgi complex subunit 3 n=2 Tax=Pseudozyma antarctica TaxID=84753 RepID=A0A081CKK7_PSEA2|nr:sec34-domain-containing protein [Moesziomyces antarcticus]GAK67203.1 sec34-domain-containing protein [Moesziomyces antarcticus]SPO48190.1 related to conserved oligomeric Golgi complex component 3 [Moesziomyces antarcticus]
MTAAPTTRPLQLDQWSNTKAPLSSSQRASVNRLAEWLHRSSSDYKQSQSQSQQQQQQQQQASSSNVETSTPSADVVDAPLLPSTASEPIALPDASAPLVSAQSFLAWYTQLSDSVSSSTHSSHIHALTHIAHTTSIADSLLAHLDACQINVAELRAGSAFVHDSSRGIREQAQALLDSHTHLDTLAEDIASRLSFFTLLPYATNMLSSPDAGIVYSSAFLELMDQLEMALLFLNQQPARTYRDAQLYRMRYAQCVTRAATLAKMAVVRDIKAHAEHTAQRLKQLASSRTHASSDTDVKGKAREITQPPQSVISKETSQILFADAEQMVTKLRPLIFELAKRAASTADTPTASTAAEFESLLQECRAAWYHTRRPLLARLLAQRIAEAEANAASQPGAGVVPLARTATQLLAHIVRAEHRLYQRFFGTDTATNQPARHDAELTAYLGELTETVASRLRPRLAKEHDLVVLADTASVVSDAIHNEEDAAWSRGMQALVDEVQSRLSARAHQVVVSDIAHFTPDADEGELDFPARILAYRSSSRVGGRHQRGKSGAGLLDAALAASRASTSSAVHKVALFTMPPALASTYYTPVRTLLEVLFHLQAHLSPRAFCRIASAGIDACLLSIGKGAAALGKRGGEKEDGWLFELRQCEILREAGVSADLVLSQNPATASDSEATRSMVDTSSLVTAINTLWTNTTSLLYPTKDSKEEGTDMQRSTDAVSTRLHELISRTASLWAGAIVLPLRVYIDHHTNTAQESKYASTRDAFDTCIASILPEKAAKVRTWIEDPEVQRMLGARIAELVAETYAKFTELGDESEGVDEVKQRVVGEWNAALA